MFDWLDSIIEGISTALQDMTGRLAEEISAGIWNTMIRWFYETIYGAAADFFSLLGNMGADLFSLSWVQATIRLFTLFGWSLFAAGCVVAVFDVAIEYQNGRGNIKTTALNVLKGFFACSLIGVVPVEAYKFSISLQNTFAGDLAALFAGEQTMSLPELCMNVLQGQFGADALVGNILITLLCMIAFAYSVVKIFFANIKRGGILLIQMTVGTLYMFSVPRGYTDGFVQWIKQVAALCLTAFLQTTMLFLGLLTFPSNLLLGIGVMLAANEVPQIAGQFGLDTSAKVNVLNVISTTTRAVSVTRGLTRAAR